MRFPVVGSKGRALGMLKAKAKVRKAPRKRKLHELGLAYVTRVEEEARGAAKRRPPEPGVN